MKYLGLGTVGVALGATVAAAIGLVLYTGPARTFWPAQAASLNLPTAKQRQDLAQLSLDLEALQQRALARPPQLRSDSLFALRAAEPVAVAQKADVKTAQPVKTARVLPRVNVILRSGLQGTAVIDDRVSQVGDSVTGGLVVKAIEARRVVFTDAAKREVVVELPVNRMGSIAAFPNSQGAR